MSSSKRIAALAGVRRSKKYPDDYIATNILGTQNIVDLCQDYKVSRIIFYSSSSVYGNVNKEDLPVTERQEKNPISLYGITKLAGEHIIKSFNKQSVIIRPFTVYGEFGRKDEVVFKWIEQIKNGLPISIYAEKTGPSTYEPKSCRGYVYVKDLVKTTTDLLQRDWDWQQEDFNVGGSEIIYLQDILTEFKSFYKDKLVKKIIPRKKEDVKNQYANTNKARSMLGFNPKPNFIKNLKRILRKYGK